jgi:hypothetical protein
MYKIKQNISKWDIFPLWLAIFSRNAAFLWCLMIIYLHLSTLDVIVSSLGQAWESGHRGFFLCHFIIIIFNSIMVQTPFKYFSTPLFNFQRPNFENNSWALLIFETILLKRQKDDLFCQTFNFLSYSFLSKKCLIIKIKQNL